MRKAFLAALLAAPALAAPPPEEPPERVHAVEAGAPGAGTVGVGAAGVSLGTAPANGLGPKSKDWERLPIVEAAPAGAAAAPGPNERSLSWNANSAPTPGTGCRVRPPNLQLGVVIHNRPEPGKYVLDATPKTCDRAFCDAVGFTGRSCCPLGPEGSPERVSCELFMLGVDPTDGVAGPHWMFSGAGTIKRHNANPFLGVVKGGKGTAYVCGNRRPNVCGSVKIP